MARYIDADALIECILKLKVVTGDMYGMGIARGIERAETAIQMQPTADVVPKSEIAKIFEEIERHSEDVGFSSFMERREFTDWIAKLKKKYTEEE